jgi:hypothetical protein
MKKYFYLIALPVILFIAGCSKEKEPAPAATVPIEGYWFGFYKINGFTTKYNTALLIRPNGTLRFYELGNKTDTILLPADLKIDAPWTFSDNVLRFGFSVGTQDAEISLARSVDQEKLNGSYKVDGVTYGIMEYKK